MLRFLLQVNFIFVFLIFSHLLAQDNSIKLPIININEDLIEVKKLISKAEMLLDEGNVEDASNLISQVENISDKWSVDLLERVDVQLINQQVKEIIGDIESMDDDPSPKFQNADLFASNPSSDVLTVIETAEKGVKFDFPIDLNEYVTKWVDVFTTSQKGYVERSLNRASPYISMIKTIFNEEGVPEDLIYLALIESGYINSAKSRASAVGMWQFIRSTGRIYGLKQNKWVDERRDPEKSTRASARYLRRLYELMGDWYIAAASYNAGPGSLDRAIRETGSSNFWDLYRSPWLRNETKEYVPKLCAAILVAKNPLAFGYVYEVLPKFTYETVTVKTQTSLLLIAKKAKITIDALKKMNPELLTTKTPPGTYQIKVPVGTGNMDLTIPKPNKKPLPKKSSKSTSPTGK